ncbi:HEAT repeat domain-containing protein [Wenyingzhuangia sp. chi5]|uniref:HEAT repeat domain-containing protein n=1 Tax=Wenyingzhuangia gilva TaxID=3057677 RepID=A0ABT8VSF3_9FLAO|nr:HEAT repeat domain-containing protein [Wenyingzhuangia sp. chi5]MDO3694912.1 HEAT repeat domain-containing protein [Wenyingzhuangia sp. chi5]
MIQLKPLIYLFFGTSLVLLIYMLIFLLIKNIKREKYKRWTKICNNIINNTVYSDDLNVKHHHKSIENLLLIKTFRKLLTKKIRSATVSFSGNSNNSLRKLYLKLRLDKYVIENLNTNNWHVKARAIQEIGIMKLENMYDKVYKNTNHRNELVRAEAQITIIKLVGFKGLKFLDSVTQPISEWYQMILLRELSHFDYDSFNGVDIWLKSKNTSVVIFALKLVDEYHLFELYKEVELCIEHPDEKVRQQTIRSITKIFNTTTANLFTSIFENETFNNQLEIAKALQKIGTEDDIPFLVHQLQTENIELKIILTRTIAQINPNNFETICSELDPDTYPMNLIILQIKEEITI